MTRWPVLLGLTTLMLAAAVPASAARVGLASGDSDPIPITDPSWQTLLESECDTLVLLPTSYRCARYDATSPISTIDFRLKNGNGALITTTDPIIGDPTNSAGGLSIVTISTLFPDGVTFRLGSLGGPLNCINCVFFSSHDIGLPDPAQVSIVAVNNVPNALFVPEPATLLLMAPAAAWTLRRRRLTRREKTV